MDMVVRNRFLLARSLEGMSPALIEGGEGIDRCAEHRGSGKEAWAAKKESKDTRKCTGPMARTSCSRAYTDRSSFSIPTAPPFKGHYGRNSPQGTDQEKFVSDNHVHTPLCNRCAHNGPTSEPDR